MPINVAYPRRRAHPVRYNNPMTNALLETQLSFPLIHRGKVRDTYDLGNDTLLLVATDRVSAFDVVMPTGVPGRGIVLSEISAFWFRRSGHEFPNHFIGMAYEPEIANQYKLGDLDEPVARRAMVVKKAERIDIECVVRGYITGSALTEYRKSGTVQGYELPADMVDSQAFETPLFTPTTKEETGHDLPLTIDELWKRVGGNIAWPLEEHSLALYRMASEYSQAMGVILADTKFEFGIIDGRISVIDELLTPDSSRYWDASIYEAGKPQPSFDKQIIRDWLTESGWNREPPAPALPDDIVQQTIDKYRDVYRMLTKQELSL